MDEKLNANWEGPYLVKEEIVPGSYRLEDMSGKLLKNSWNASFLKRYYVLLRIDNKQALLPI